MQNIYINYIKNKKSKEMYKNNLIYIRYKYCYCSKCNKNYIDLRCPKLYCKNCCDINKKYKKNICKIHINK